MTMLHKSNSTKVQGGQRDYTEPPHFPDDLSKSSIAQFKQDRVRWWNAHVTNIRAMEQDLEDLRQKINSS